MSSSRSTSPSNSSLSSDSSPAELDWMRQQTQLLREKLLAQQRQEARQEERNARRALQNAIVSKRSQWKAASARYYENHPEARERKRVKMAEQRAAKKLARRRWDPPKKSKPADVNPAAEPTVLPPSKIACKKGLPNSDAKIARTARGSKRRSPGARCCCCRVAAFSQATPTTFPTPPSVG
ncbi:hypothetical protein B0H19DRAFT_1079769 [Mycena capillaripes]|nr:hypothetical protein B0H19DRAFT_1079769 [Mycena capillaripes]